MKKEANLKIEYEVIVKDKKGNIIHKQKNRSKSLLKNFMLWLHSKFTISTSEGATASWTATDMGNVGRSFPVTGTNYEGEFGHFGAVAAADGKGIVVGKGTTTVIPADYNLDDKIAHGTGSGQMLHGAQTYEAVEVVEDDSRFRITRTFTNNSGALISVKEIGAVLSQMDTAFTERFLLYLRDVLVSPSSVPDAATLTVRYRFTVTA